MLQGQPNQRFAEFSFRLKQLFEAHPLPPFATVDEEEFRGDRDAYHKALAAMRAKANRQWSKWEKMSNWGDSALQRLIDLTTNTKTE